MDDAGQLGFAVADLVERHLQTQAPLEDPAFRERRAVGKVRLQLAVGVRVVDGRSVDDGARQHVIPAP